LIVLALDLSKSSSGFAVGDGKRWTAGCLKCPYQPPDDMRSNDIDAGYSGLIANWFRHSLHAIIEEHRPQRAAIEKPLPGNLATKRKYFQKNSDAFGESLVSVESGGTSYATLHYLHGLAFEACGLLHRKNIPTIFVAAQTWRRSLGIGQPPKTVKDRRKWLKQECVEQLRLRGFDVSQPDAAEAVGIGIHLLGALNLEARVGALL
jgi:hypothetical protein